MGRLFAGTPFDRPPTCDRCGRLEAACACPAPVAPRPEPSTQLARLKVEKRAKGKVVTSITGLDPAGGHLDELAATLKGKVGTGGTCKDGVIELQGDRLDAVDSALRALGYQTRRS